MELLEAQLREKSGTGTAREIRRNGYVPGIIYGANKQEIRIAVPFKELTRLHHKGCFKSTVIEISVNGKKYKALPKAMQFHPVTDAIEHIDFVFLGDKEQKVDVKIQYEGVERSLGVKRGGFFNIVNRSIPLICNVKNIPQSINIDVSKMRINDSLKAHDIPLPAGCTHGKKNNYIVATITGRGGKQDDEADKAAAAAPAK